VITETVVLDSNDPDTWRSIVLTGTRMTIAGMTNPIRVRFGITSVSEGMLLQVDDVMEVEETIYVQPIPNKRTNKNVKTSLYVHKD